MVQGAKSCSAVMVRTERRGLRAPCGWQTDMTGAGAALSSKWPASAFHLPCCVRLVTGHRGAAAEVPAGACCCGAGARLRLGKRAAETGRLLDVVGPKPRSGVHCKGIT